MKMNKARLQTVKQVMDLAITEILELRRKNEILQARVDTMNLFAVVLNTAPHEVLHAASEEVVWELRNLSQEIETDIGMEISGDDHEN